MHGDGAVVPGIIQLMAAIRGVNYFHAELSRCFGKAARLVSQLARQQQQPLRLVSDFADLAASRDSFAGIQTNASGCGSDFSAWRNGYGFVWPMETN